MRRRIRPLSPTLSIPTQLHSNQRETGYSPSFGKKGSAGMPYSSPSTVYPPFPDLDPPFSNEPPIPLNLANNYNPANNFNTVNMYNSNGGRANNSLTIMTNLDDNPDADPALQQQQHRARIWSTLKPSALATFPMGSHSDPPKRRFSGRNRKESFPSEGGAYVDNSNLTSSNYGYLTSFFAYLH
jgi:hypothetical protein